jgi:phosphoserine phosphatase
VRLEAAGVPTVLVATASFAALARQVADSYGLPQARIAVVEHPLGGILEADVVDRAERVVDEVLSLVTGDR